MMRADEIIGTLGLVKHPQEGGYFLETYRSSQSIPIKNLPPGYGGDRPFSTAIFYMLTPDTCSEMHRLRGDEIFHFYLGSPVEMLQLFPDGSGKRVIIGNDIQQGMILQVVVPAGVWQGSRLVPGGEFALLGTTMSPGFDFADYQPAVREELIHRYPRFKDLIKILTRE